MDKYLDAATLREARDALSNAAQGVLGAYCVTALRCIDRMIPRRVHEEYDTRLFQSRYNDGWREYQCPECKCAS